MPGYANKVQKLGFPELSSGPDDPIWVVIRNPKVLPLDALQPALADVDLDDEGKPRALTTKQAIATGQAVGASLVVAWRVYDATTSPDFDPLTGDEVPGTGQVLLPPPPVDASVFAKLPAVIITRVMNEIAEAINPTSGQGAFTVKTSSGQPNRSTTEPGGPVQDQLS